MITENITGVQHLGIPTLNIDRTIEFYQRLGFILKHETVDEGAGARVAFLQLKNIMVETYEADMVSGKAGAIDHVALDVSDVDAVFETIKAAGFDMLDDEVNFLPFWENGVKFFTIVGPNSEKIEFCQKM